MSKEKDKKNKKKDKSGKKGKASASSGGVAKAAKGLKSITDNPLVADVVAAALVGAAAALKDSNKARQLASDAGDQLTDLSKTSVDRGNAMWQLALDVGRKALDALAEESRSRPGRKG